MPVDHLGAATWCSSALIQSGHNWFESNGISFMGELLYTGNNQEVWQFYFSTLQSSATVYDITAFFSNYMGGLIYVGLKIWPIPCMYTLWMTLGQVNMQGITYRHYRVSCTQAGCRWLLWLAKYSPWGLLSSTSCYNTGSHRPHHCYPVANKVENINCGQSGHTCVLPRSATSCFGRSGCIPNTWPS